MERDLQGMCTKQDGTSNRNTIVAGRLGHVGGTLVPTRVLITLNIIPKGPIWRQSHRRELMGAEVSTGRNALQGCDSWDHFTTNQEWGQSHERIYV
jgi:hypothetical protein